MKKSKLTQLFAVAIATSLILGTVSLGYASSGMENAKKTTDLITTNEGADYEKPLPRNQILYSEIADKIKAIQEKNPSVMKYEVIGQTNQGRDLYLVTITDSQGMRELQTHKDFMKNAVNNPQTAIDYVKKNNDYKVPVFFNASIHGNETPGVDGVFKLMEKLTTDTDAEVQSILKNCVILINVVQNPDGRASGVRENGAGVDLNRDYITQSQPETQAIVKNVATTWYPTTMLDLHGFMTTDNILLEPCTIPHNPNYEYDLLSKNLLPHAKYMAEAMKKETGWEVDIPAEIWEDGWDDYPPIFTPQYFMYFGTIGHTLEIKYADQKSIDADLAACYGALQYAAKNKQNLLTNQFEIFNRGVKGLEVEQDVHFPKSYIIPVNDKQQKDIYEAYKMIQHMLNNGIVVEQATVEFTANGVNYPEGTYLVPMKQGLRGLANTMLWKGEDVTKLATEMYDISAYSFPLLNGFEAVPVWKEFKSETKRITEVVMPTGDFSQGSGINYAMPVDNDSAYLVANTLVKEGFKVYRTKDMVSKYQAGTFVIPEQSGVDIKLKELASQNPVNIVGIGETKATLQPVMLKKIAIVEEDGGTYTAMHALGFDVNGISYNAVNNGYDFEKNGFDSLVVSGSQYFWEDSYDDSGTTWSLDSRGVKNLVGFAKNHDFIGAGYAGSMLNEEVKKLDVRMNYIGKDNYQTAENGICTFDAKKNDPITYGYGKGEIVFAFKPMWVLMVNNLSAEVSGSYGVGPGMYKVGYWPEPERLAGAYAIVHDKSDNYDAVLFGIVPTFRGYNHATNGMMANAMYYLGYDGK